MNVRMAMLIAASMSAFWAAPVAAYNDCSCALRCFDIDDEDARNQCLNACAAGSGDACQPGPNP